MQLSRSARDVYRVAAELAAEGRDCALAMVLKTEGSSPCRAGAKAIMDATDVIQGTIGGGLLEATIQRRVAETLASGRAIIVDFGLQSSSVDGAEPICGGSVRVLVDPAVGRHRDAYLAACEMRDRRRRGVVLTTIEPAASAGLDQRNVAVETLPERAFSERALAAGGGFPGADAVRAVLRREAPRLFVSESAPAERRLEVFVEPLVPLPVVVVVGGGHVGQAVAAQASAVGFAIVVIDDRP
jgi:xanthine dehydrogenase accessory factor